MKAGVCFYGIPPVALADPVNLKIPMQFHFADKDLSAGFADIKACDELRDKLKPVRSVVEYRHDKYSHPSATRSNNLAEFHRFI